MAARFKIFVILLFVSALFTAGTTVTAASAERINFSRDILPILSDNCYQCHGPDEQARKGKLRFDTKEGAFRLKDGKAVIAPGKSSESELIRRINSTDPDDVMPPPKSNRKLTAQQMDLLKRWIDQGAVWSRHWSFEAPQHPEIPTTKTKNFVHNPIDSFVLARLEKEKLKPAIEARKETLLRRITFDLTGLPPTPTELDAFLADKSPNAYEKVVDRLLASSRYGERMAVDWLDIARFADTHGYQMDRYRAVWPYRDWVIKAFNQNLSYDKFILWQLAGDLLPNATKEQRLATAFNRLHCQNEEGGIVEEEYRVAYVVDRVNTMGTAFLGLTLECSRCHDHKFDPITQRDYYSLFAFFQNIDESGQTSYFTDSMPVPTLLLSDDATDMKLARLQNDLAEKEHQLAALRESARNSLNQWLATNTQTVEISGLVASFSFDEITANKITNAADSSKSGNAVENPKLIRGKSGQCANLSGENGFTFPGLGHFNRTDPFSISLWLQTPSYAPRAVVLHHSKAPIDAGSRGYELLLEHGRVAFGLHHMWPGNSLKVVTKASIPSNQWMHVSITYDGSSRANGIHIYLNGLLASLDVIRDGLSKDITYENGEPELAIGYRFRDNGFKDGRVDDFKLFNRALTRLEVSQLSGDTNALDLAIGANSKLTPSQREELFAFYFDTIYAPALKLNAELHQLRQEQNRLINPIAEVMVMQEMPQPKPAYILKRGAYDSHGEQVSANTPASLPSFSAGEQRDRLGLARWLLSSENPLTARVTVNRAWQMMFGRGIVETSDNFGKQGTFPTHPELLDWLACEFRENGWDMKHLLKLIAMSSTYRQSSQCSEELLARDPANELLARGPARRLTAEMLRDQALAVSGLLVEKLGGPSVKPYQPDGLWEEKAMGAPHYDQGHGDDLHRRSLYTFWKRTVPPPAMIAFDSSEKNICTVRRQSTSTPLQSLALLNDTQIIEAARHVSQRMLKECSTNLESQVSWAFRLITNRSPTSKEIKVLKALYEEQRDIFAADKKSAEKLLALGEAKNDQSLNTADLAAGTVLTEAIFNHDAAVMRR